MRLLEHEPLAPRTTFKIGGSARFLIEAATAAEIEEALSYAAARSVPAALIGAGANMLADDGEAEGVFVAPRIEGLAVEEDERGARITAGAAEPWDRVVEEAVERGLWGLENLSAIPGSVGGAVVQNIGAYGAALSQCLVSVEAFDRRTGAVGHLSREACAFGYRSSVFKQEPSRYAIIRATFRVSRAGEPNVAYRDLREQFPQAPTLKELRAGITAVRARKFPDLAQEGTAGSFFANPSVSKEEADALKERFPELPLYPLPESADIKVPIAWILDRVLNLRGYRLGPARLFERQALVIVADRDAHARDVRALALDVQSRVRDAVQIALSPEVVVMHGAQQSHALE